MTESELRHLVDRMVEQWWMTAVKPQAIVLPTLEEEAKSSLKERIVRFFQDVTASP